MSAARRARSAPALLDGAPSLFQIGGRNTLDEDVAVREPRPGNLLTERDGDHFMRGSERQVGGKEVKAAGDEILVGGDCRGVRGIVPVRESDQRRRVDERDVPQDVINRGIWSWWSVGRHLALSPASDRR